MPAIVHFDMGVDDVERAGNFYQGLFDWKMFSPPGMEQYKLIETADQDGNPGIGGGMAKRDDATLKITMYVGVDDIDKYTANVVKLGGQVLIPKTSVPGWGYSVVCADTEGNPFGLWQDEPKTE